MLNKIRSQPIQYILAFIFPALLFWGTGEGAIPNSALKISEKSTATSPSPEETVQVEGQNFSSATPSFTPTPTPIDSTATSIPRPLPAIFATGAYASDELTVRFKASTRQARIEECFQDIDIEVRGEIEELRARVIRINSGELGNAYYHILACAGVLYVEPNFLLQATDTIPNDPNWGLQYGLLNIRAPQGWGLTTGSADVTIAIVDTGVDYRHPDLAGKLVSGYDFVNNDSDPQDDHGHGTHVAGIAAASSNNGVGVAGVSWGARIMPVKVLNSSAGGTYADTADGVIWAVDHGAQVINLSLGGTGVASVLADAINYAHSNGAVVVAAAGNTSSNFILYPARYPNVIAVAKTNSTDNWDGSNYGPEIDLSAPGAMIYSTIIGSYDYKSGSSMSTAYVSGLAAILLGIPGNVSPDTIESQMESTALDIEFTGWDEYTGAGLIQMDAAIRLAWSPTPIPGAQSSSVPRSGNGNIPGQIIPTNTPIPFWTASPTPSMQEATTTFTPEATSSPSVTKSPTETLSANVNEVQAQGASSSKTYILPCVGLAFILLGIFLIWYSRRKNNNDTAGA